MHGKWRKQTCTGIPSHTTKCDLRSATTHGGFIFLSLVCRDKNHQARPQCGGPWY